MLRAMNRGDLGRTLLYAADAGGLLDVRFLLAAGADAGADDGWALYAACNGGHRQVAEALLDAGGTLTPLHRNIALIRAAIYGRTACCELLLDRGADIRPLVKTVKMRCVEPHILAVWRRSPRSS